MAKSIIIYKNVFEDGTNLPSATSEASNGNIENILDLNVGSFWISDSVSFPQYITIEKGVLTAFDSLTIIGHNFGSNAYEISIEHSDDDPEGSSGAVIEEALAPFIPDDDKAIAKTFTSASNYWIRLKIDKTSPESDDEEPFAAVIMIGEKLQFDNLNTAPFVLRDEKPIKENPISKGGQHLRTTKLRTDLTFKGTLSVPSIVWVISDFLPFWENHAEDGNPFFWIPDIANYPALVYFVRWLEGFSFQMPMSTGDFVDRIRYHFVAIKEED